MSPRCYTKSNALKNVWNAVCSLQRGKVESGIYNGKYIHYDTEICYNSITFLWYDTGSR